MSGLELYHRKAGDAVEVSHIGGPDRVTQLESACSDEEIRKREIDSRGGAFAADPRDDLSSRSGYRVDRESRLQIVKKGAAAALGFRCVGAVDAVADLGNRNRTQDNGYFLQRSGGPFQSQFGQ